MARTTSRLWSTQWYTGAMWRAIKKMPRAANCGRPKVPQEVLEFVLWLGVTLDIRHAVKLELMDYRIDGICLTPGHHLPYIYAVLGKTVAETLDTIAHEFVLFDKHRA